MNSILIKSFNTIPMKTFLRIFAVLLLLFLSFGALYGGYMLISDPSGQKFQWTVELLEKTPFNNFLIPGIILFTINGLLPLFIVILVIINSKKHPWFIIAQGFILIGWLTAEIIFDKNLFVAEMHYPSYATGILLVVVGIFLLRISKNTS